MWDVGPVYKLTYLFNNCQHWGTLGNPAVETATLVGRRRMHNFNYDKSVVIILNCIRLCAFGHSYELSNF